MTGPQASIVVACYEMERALPRTLLSLSPRYQRDCLPGTVEVIVVDNGSRKPPRAQDFADLGLDLQIHLCGNGSPSPVAAMNFGIARARAPLVCAWIDGARMASPSVISACLAAAALHPRAVVATPNYHIGPGPQYLTTTQGYDEAEEDRLLASINWPAEGDRLFDISTPVWHAGENGRMLESNALFLQREMWETLGGYDERFTSAGGGAANADVFTRAVEAPDAQLIRVRGAATFHQIHGGTTSNAPNFAIDAAKLISREYYRLRGRPMKAVRDTGWVYDAHLRTLVRGP